jgi:hypothetical protein
MYYEKTQSKGNRCTDVALGLGALIRTNQGLPSTWLFLALGGIIPEQSNKHDGSTTLRDIQNEAVVVSALNSVCTLCQLARPEPAGLSTLTRTVTIGEVIACMLAMLASLASLLQKKTWDRHISYSL